MTTSSKISFEEFLNLPEQDGVRFELDEGELIVNPSPTPRHNIIRDRILVLMKEFVVSRELGEVIAEMDFRLASNIVRSPDVAFITKECMKKVDLDQTPIEGAPTLAIEVISPSNSAEDTAGRVRAYLAAGCRTVWVVYPGLRLVEVHDQGGVTDVPSSLGTENPQEAEVRAEGILPGFAISLSYIFDGKT